MRVRLITAAVTLAAVLVTAVAAQAGPVTVALYRFQSQGEVLAFYKVQGAKCSKKWRKQKTLGATVGKGTNACGFRSSVVADSQDPAPDQEMAASTNLAAPTPKKLRKKIYMAVAIRQSDTTSYQLRVFPAIRKWQVWRDPRGSAPPALLGAGAGRFIRQGVGVRNEIALRAFDYGTSTTTILAKINRKRVLSARDSSANQPNGRKTVLMVGAKGRASARRAVAAFDNVAIRVPNPF